MGVGQATGRQPRIGLLGGSFDPVHLAHLALAQAAQKALDLTEVWWIPAGRPWQREALGASAEHRLAMLELALRDQSGMRILTLELERAGTTYTWDTLLALGIGEASEHEFVWLLGSDQLRNFCSWHRWQDIARRVRLAVAERPGHPTHPPQPLADQLQEQATPLLPFAWRALAISATDIRWRVANQQSIDGLTAPEVVQYIDAHRLYSRCP